MQCKAKRDMAKAMEWAYGVLIEKLVRVEKRKTKREGLWKQCVGHASMWCERRSKGQVRQIWMNHSKNH